jgi:hypothetical protein
MTLWMREPSGWPPRNAVQAPQALSFRQDKCMPRYSAAVEALC